MNLIKKLILPFSMSFLIVGCGPGDQNSGQLQEEPVNTTDNTITRNEVSLTPVKGVFKNPEKDCKEGFGLCAVQILPPQDQNIPVDTMSQKGERLINATFRMDTETENTMVIEFLENVPTFQDQFIVAPNTIYSNLFGFSQITIDPSTYDSDKSIGQYGGVQVRILKQ